MHVALLAWLGLGAGLLPCAVAATFTVNSTADALDDNPGGGVCRGNPIVACTTDAQCAATAIGPCDLCATGDTVMSPEGLRPQCTLRAAIEEANATSAASVIDVPAGTYKFAQTSACTYSVQPQPNVFWTSTQGSLCLSSNVTIQGAGADTTIIDADQRTRVLFVSAHAVAELRGVTIANGVGDRSFGNLHDIPSRAGGGIMNDGTLTLTESVVRNNSVLPGSVNGGGIRNAGVLTLERSRVSDNVSTGGQLGGGIYNQYGAVLSVRDSTISGNFVATAGGGISNDGGVVTITNSTVTGNMTNGVGGGISSADNVPFIAVLTIVNSTISGNTSGSAGGGIATTNGVTELNNVTITDNTGATDAGSGGGIASYNGVFALRNSIVAGNRDALLSGTAPDCSGRFVSRGYNVIQDLAGCIVTGDLTGNIVGQDAQLGPLGDYGGPTATHALLAGSPAIGAGNPAAPGSGGLACTAIDQRWFTRVGDDGCDIGAFQRTGAAGGFSLASIRPVTGGNTGSVVGLVYGSGFESGATVRLTRAGQADIVGTPMQVDVAGSAIAATFDLLGQAIGPWDVVVRNPDGTSSTLAAGFTIEAERAADIWVDVLGTRLLKAGRPSRLTILYGNRGNVDAVAVPISFSFPSAYALSRFFQITPPPPHAGQVRDDWSRVPVSVLTDTASGFVNVPLLLQVVPAGFTGMLQIELTSLPGALDGQIVVAVGNPLFDGGLAPDVVTNAVAGAQAYLQTEGLTIPSALVPDLEQYLIDQFQQVKESGHAAFVANLGTQPEVYSTSQLFFDLVAFAAVRAGGDAHAAAMPATAWMSALGRVLVSRVSQLGPAEAEAQQNCPVIPCNSGQVLPGGCTCSTGNEPFIPPEVPIPPGCETLKDRLTLAKCKPTEAHCKDLGTHKVVERDDGTTVCVPKDPPKGCPKDPLKIAPGTQCRTFPLRPRSSFDPNDKVGSLGVSPSQFLLGATPLSYTVFFENLENATAAAQEVVVTDQLDAATMDFDTFRLGRISFGQNITLVPAPGTQQYSGGVDLRPEQNLVVTVVAGLDRTTGVLSWRFTSIDPDTGQFPEDPSVGFLPPNVTSPDGEGSVVFTIEPKTALTSGSDVCNRARIVFDLNAAIETPQWCNRIDTDGPVTAVDPVLAGCSGALSVHWSGSDAGAGLDTFTIFVSEDGAPWSVWLADTTDTSGVYPAQAGRTYAFYSIGVDNVGNVEAAPGSPDVVVTPATGCCTTNVECADGNVCNGDETCDVATRGCVAGAPLVCVDDGDACTTEACAPATGCTHTPIPSCPGTCAADCPDADPCTVDECVDGRCERTELDGTAGARCVCQRQGAPACEGQALPERLTKKTAAACVALDRAVMAIEPKPRKKLLKKAASSWRGAGKLLGRRAVAAALSADCRQALGATFDDAASRALGATAIP
jgi:hypothetical protein